MYKAQHGAEICVQDNCTIEYEGRCPVEAGQVAERMGSGLWNQATQGRTFVLPPISSACGGEFLHL